MSGLSKITVNIASGGLGRRAVNRDKVSGMLFYSATYPAGFSSTVQCKKVYQLADAVTAGITNALFPKMYYQISEYFRLQPDGELWVGVFPVPGGTYDFSELATMADNYAQGEIRQAAIWADVLTYATTQVTSIQAIVTALEAKGFYLSVGYGANMAATADITTLATIRTLTAPRVSVIIVQDGGGVGAALALSTTKSVPALGAWLGCVSKALVSQSIGNPTNFNLSNGVELEILAFANAQLYPVISASALGTLKDNGYTVPRKYLPSLAGSYFERCPTAVVATNDFAWLETNRTIGKAIRGVVAVLLPQLQSGINTNSDGTLSADVIGYFTDLCNGPLLAMQAAGEISNPADGSKTYRTLIDPNQNVQATSLLTVTIQIIPVGIAEFITVNIGLTTALT